MAIIRRKSKPNMESLSFLFHVTVTASLSRSNAKTESRRLSVISLYDKGMSVSDIEEEMREIFSTSAISIITNKVNQAAQE